MVIVTPNQIIAIIIITIILTIILSFWSFAGIGHCRLFLRLKAKKQKFKKENLYLANAKK